jgi:hypothetical protein
MRPIVNEVQAMQNPALGAGLLWRFACGYCPQTSGGHGAPLPLLFVVLPVTLHMRTCGEVLGTRTASGLRKFEEKFRENSDLLLAIHRRALAMRSLTLRSLGIAIGSGLVTMLREEASIWPRSYAQVRGIPKPIEDLFSASERLGTWCRPLSLFEISGILRVEF